MCLETRNRLGTTKEQGSHIWFLLRIAVSWEHHTDRELWKEEYQLDINPNDKVVYTYFFSLSLVHSPKDLRTRKSPHTTEASFSRSRLPLRSEGGTPWLRRSLRGHGVLADNESSGQAVKRSEQHPSCHLLINGWHGWQGHGSLCIQLFEYQRPSSVSGDSWPQQFIAILLSCMGR